MKKLFYLFVFVLFSIKMQAQSVTITGTNINCYGNCDGSMEAIATGGSSPYSFVWSDGRTDALRQGICAGIYAVTVTDNLGAAQMAAITITTPSSALSISTISLPTLGANPCTGTAWVTASGGTTPYTYSWDFFAGSSTIDTAYSLCQREHCVTVTDNFGCVQTSCITVALDNGTAVQQTPLFNLNVYPNPASSLLFFDFEFNNKAKAQLINALGLVLLESSLNSKENWHQIDISNLPSGFYIFKLTCDKQYFSKQVLIER